MTLIDTIKSQQLEARKTRHAIKASLLTTLLGELQTLAKNSGREEANDAQVVVLVKKFIKNAGDVVDATKNMDNIQALARLNDAKAEIAILESFLPKQLSEEELRALIAGFAAEGKDIGDAMKTLKTQHTGMYDGGLASKLMKELL